MYLRPKYNARKAPRILQSAKKIPVTIYAIHKPYFWRIKEYTKQHKIAKKIDPDKKSVKKGANLFYFMELNVVLGLIVIFRWEWWRYKRSMKTT